MAVYSLQPEPEICVLLAGDEDLVVEFARVLTSKNVDFRILPNIDELRESALDDDFDSGLIAATAMSYGEFSDKVTIDPMSAVSKFTAAAYLSLEAPEMYKDTLSVLTLAGFEGPLIVTTLTCTATDIGQFTDCHHSVVGVGLIPGLIATTNVIEVAPGLNTRDEYVIKAEALLNQLGMKTERVEDRMAMVKMRVLATLINEAAFAVMEGVASAEDIDNAMKLGVNYPKGLLEWADQIGVHIVTAVLEALYQEYGQERYRPCVLLKQYMRAGWLGQSTGKGFYTHKAPEF